MSNLPRVSVVLPTFNRASLLQRSIRSVLSQTISDLELIIVDDASTDGTENIVKGFDDNRIRYKKLPNNVGGAEARNVGIRMARAELIAFQDSDDEWTCSKLEKTLKFWEAHDETGAIFTSYIQIWDSGCRLMPLDASRFDSGNIYESLLWQNYIGTPTLIVKKEYLERVGGFDPSMPRYQDWDLALSLSQVTSIAFMKEPHLIANVTKGSITHSSRAHRVALEKLHIKHLEIINRKNKLRAEWLCRVGDAKMRDGSELGRRFLLEAFLRSPLNAHYFIKLIFSLPGSTIFYNKCLELVKKIR